MAYDASKELEDELNQTLFRTLLTILILLIFVFLVSRDFRYLLIIAVSLAANVLIALVFYYFLKVEIHIYTLAGITVSFGIIIDNVIVMADHYRHHRDRKVFMAILAATLTTMGALTVIFNMNNEIMRNMWDFTTVIIVNLSVSLFVALFFVPALMEKIPLRKKEARVRVACKGSCKIYLEIQAVYRVHSGDSGKSMGDFGYSRIRITCIYDSFFSGPR